LQQHGLSTVRATLADVAVQGKLRDGTLRLGGERVAVVYYRAGYTPSDFVHPDAGAGRRLLEASDAIQIPDLAMQLAGMKKVQQRLTSLEVLTRFVSESQAAELLEVCAEMHSLDADSKDAEFALAEASEHPERFVLKPQREGGGHNVYGAEIVKLLAEMPPEERSGWVLMERLHPVPHDAVLLMDHQSQSLRCVSELGRYGVLLAKGNEVRLNKDAGYLVRTKGAEVDEGGVSAGYACLNSLVRER
jgi:glutathione synthase